MHGKEKRGAREGASGRGGEKPISRDTQGLRSPGGATVNSQGWKPLERSPRE